MNFRSLLVLLDSEATCQSRTEYAIQLARSLDAHLVGLVPTGLPDLPLTPTTAAALSAYLAKAEAALQDQGAHLAQKFKTSCDQAGAHAVEAVTTPDDPAMALARHVPYCDLAVVSQPDPAQSGYSQARAALDQVVQTSPRPTLILPYAGSFQAPARRVLVGWDESREGARAVADAMPLLVRAEQVRVVRFIRDGDDKPVLHERIESLVRWLAWHGVKAEASVEVTAIGYADALLSRASDVDAEMIVMGAYGHARWTQRMLGGATRGILETMTVPVLMSR
ncbi:universal stress protein [Aquabacterium sp.]|uniref:universal stress protein n=1 Tax=Aquabacterium sp. TaxID=1872578 RepID=UPI003784719C